MFRPSSLESGELLNKSRHKGLPSDGKLLLRWLVRNNFLLHDRNSIVGAWITKKPRDRDNVCYKHMF